LGAPKQLINILCDGPEKVQISVHFSQTVDKGKNTKKS
jgi:hypothetical protein